MNQPASPYLSPGGLSSPSTDLEGRIAAIETENRELRKKLDSLTNSYLTRAFAVWGHDFVGQVIITIPTIMLYVIFLILVLSSGSLRS